MKGTGDDEEFVAGWRRKAGREFAVENETTGLVDDE